MAALAIATTLAALAAAAVPPSPVAAALDRARAARGTAAGWRARVRRLPLVARWRPFGEDVLRHAGLPEVAPAEVVAAKVFLALTVAIPLVGVGAPLALVLLGSYLGFIAPSVWIDRRAATRLEARRRALLPMLERVVALNAAGWTVERAFALAAEGAGALAPTLRDASARAALGVSFLDACAEVAERDGTSELRDIAVELGRARYGGRSLLPALRERRDTLRLARRAERVEAASRVDGALSLVLVLAYLPALLLVVVIPLFLGLLRALGS